MSGEATPREGTRAPETLDRAFGTRAICNRCGEAVGDYRVIARFLHDVASVRAYCPGCYDEALDGRHDARGDGLWLGFDEFAARFGMPGPRPKPSAVDRTLAALLRRGDLRMLSPSSECLARRRGGPPWRFEIELLADGPALGSFALGADGAVTDARGDRAVLECLGQLPAA